MRSTQYFYYILLTAGSIFLALANQSIAEVETKRILIEYEEPKNPAHQSLYDMLKEHHALEKLQEVFSPFKFPMNVTIKTVGCDGHANAWYVRPTLRICYEYLEVIRRDMPIETTAAGVTPIDAAVGQFFFAAAHEMGHATFDLLDVPVFGAEEDAADQFATYIMLQFGKADARRLILGAAYSYRRYLLHPTVTAPLKDFSDSHGAPQQRFFNLICLAYGADPNLFGDFVQKDFLPEHRAKGCRREYGNVVWAFRQLIKPHLDQQLARQVLDQTWLPSEDATRSN